MRTSSVYEEDGVWVVDLLEDDVLQESCYLFDKNKRYAEDLSENWDAGIKQLSCNGAT